MIESVSFPLTRNQRAIWLEARLFPDTPIFNIGTYVLLNGIPDKTRLERAIQTVIQQNDAMRMHIGEVNREPRAYFHEEVNFHLQIQQFDSIDDARTWMNIHFTIPIPIHDEQLFEIMLVIAGNQSFLYLKHHHIYIDGWSRALLVRAIADAYNEVETPTQNYSTFLEKDFEPVDDSTLNFWKETFRDFERNQTFEPKTDEEIMPSKRYVAKFDSVEKLSRFDDKEQFYLQLSALITTIAISRSKEEVTIGIPLLNRYDEEALNTIGYYVSLLPLRIKIRRDIPFQKLVEEVKAALRATRNHRDLSIQEINKNIGINFANYSQAYDVVFSFEKHDHKCHFGLIQAIEAGTFSSNFEQNPLVIHAQQFLSSDSMDLVYDFNLKYFNDEEILKFSERYLRVLDTISRAPASWLSDLEVLNHEESILIASSSKAIRRIVAHTNICSSIIDCASVNAGKVILKQDAHEVTYIELMSQALNVAGAIQYFQSQAHNAVGIFLPRSENVITAIAGVVLSGRPFVYIDPSLSKTRIKYILQDSNIQTIVTSSKEKIPDSLKQFRRIDLDTTDGIEMWKQPTLSAESPLYYLYTSGTTGLPKGVIITHGGILNLMAELNAGIFSNYSDNERLALVSSFSFDASMQFIFACLCLGKTLTIVPEDTRKDGRELVHFLAENAITICDGIPTHLNSMMIRVVRPPENFIVKHFLIGGEAMRKKPISDFFKWLNRPATITNAYGPTECSVDATLFTFDEKVLEIIPQIPIGQPINNTFIHILDPRGIQVPPGVKGEICIGGAGLAIGYLNQPELTEDKFQNHPAYGRIYRSGDLGTWNASGQILCFGRMDNQVKIRGYRIEPEEIETQMMRIPDVNEASIVVKSTERYTQLIAFATCKNGMVPNQIRRHLENVLPDYMIPHAIEIIESMPLTNTGKTDRKALEKRMATTQLNHESKQDLTNTEIRVRAIFDQNLGIQNTDIEQSFFSLGGDSLSLIFLLADIEEEFGLELPMNVFAHLNSIQQISSFIENQEIQKSSAVSLEDGIARALFWEVPKKMPPPSKTNKAFLTGVTGFVGAFLLMELLEHYDEVYCLIRSSSVLHAQVKLETALNKYELHPGENRTKIRLISGDLSLPGLGLDDTTLQILSEEIKVVYHSGADVHFLKDVASMEPANVWGTSELLKLCCTNTLKEFHLISTVGVFNKSDNYIDENASIITEMHSENMGYEGTKWLAEGLTIRLRQHGLKSSIFRLARVTGHSKTGVARNEDFFHRMLRGCIQLGYFPKEMLDTDTDLTPVDITVKGIVALSREKIDKNYHFINPNRAAFRKIIDALEKFGVSLQPVSIDQFLEIAGRECKSNEHPLFSILPVLKQKSWFSVNSKRFTMDNTLSALKSHDLSWPEVDELIAIYTERLLQNNNDASNRQIRKTE